MTPAQYEQRCAEMLRMNAHNMTPREIERFAYGAADQALLIMTTKLVIHEAVNEDAECKLEQIRDIIS